MEAYWQGIRVGLMQILAGVCLLCSSTLLASQPMPLPFSAHYQGSRFLIFSLESDIVLEHIGQYIKYTLNTQGSLFAYTARVYDCSVMKLGPQGLLPLEHKHIDEENSKYDAHTIFDWDNKVAHVTTEYGGKSGDIAIDPNNPVWDPISLQIHVIMDVMSGQLSQPKTYPLLEYRELSQWPIAIQEQESLDTDYGDIHTVSVQRTDGKSFKLWLAKDFGYFPIMVELNKYRVSAMQDPNTVMQSAKPSPQEQPHC